MLCWQRLCGGEVVLVSWSSWWLREMLAAPNVRHLHVSVFGKESDGEANDRGCDQVLRELEEILRSKIAQLLRGLVHHTLRARASSPQVRGAHVSGSLAPVFGVLSANVDATTLDAADHRTHVLVDGCGCSLSGSWLCVEERMKREDEGSHVVCVRLERPEN
jgi:hypothetical protein